MSIIKDNADIIMLLENSLTSGKHIIVYGIDDTEIMYGLFGKVGFASNPKYEIWHRIKNIVVVGGAKYISKEQMHSILELYGMYDFSDKVTVLSDDLRYGNLYNYVRNGLLTKEEMVDALLYNI